MLNPALRTRLQRFSKEMESPFGSGRKAEKLTGALYANRYSLRLSDAHRVIFDQVDQTIIYRALGPHDESYKRAERLSAPDLAHALPFANIYDDKQARKRRQTARHSKLGSVQSDALKDQSFAASRLASKIPERVIVPPGDDLDTEFGFVEVEPNSSTPSAEMWTSEQYLIVSKGEEMLAALSGRMTEWMLFLPEDHRRYVTMASKGPTRIFGPSGTGKTCILLHKAVFWAKQTDSEVLVLTFRPTLVKVITRLKDSLCLGDPTTGSKIRVASIVEIASELLGIKFNISSNEKAGIIANCCKESGAPPLSLRRKLRGSQSLEEFVENEITHWIKGAAYRNAEIYQALPFPRGKAQLSPEERAWLFGVFEHYERQKGKLRDDQDIILDAYEATRDRTNHSKWSAILIDEFQDLSLCSLSFIKNLAALNPERRTRETLPHPTCRD
jgi:hypothetical protein